jgi:hypothetical protein
LDDRTRRLSLGRAGLALAFAALGCLGIVRALTAPPPPSQPARRVERLRDGLAPYTTDRVTRLRRQIRAEHPNPRLRLRIARALAACVAVRAHQEYSAAFPDAFQYGRYPAEHYESWRRGFYRRDRDGDLRQALQEAALASQPDAPLAVRLGAFHLTAHVLRQQGRNREACIPLRQILHLTPCDRPAWLHLSEVYRDLGDESRFRAARRRLQRLDAESAALPTRRARWVS